MGVGSTSEEGSDGADRAGTPARELFPRVYEELRGLAAHYIRSERAGHTLQPTALVHEAFLRLASDAARPWKTENEFIAIAASAMRHILVDHARKRDAIKRGGGDRPLTIDSRASGCGVVGPRAEVDLLALDEVLDRLESLHPRQARLVVLRVFGGLPVEAAAELMDVAPSTAYKDWDMARAWLLRELGG